MLNSFNVASEGYVIGGPIGIATNGYISLFDELDRLAGWGGRKRKSRAYGRLVDTDIDKALAELEKAKKLAAKTLGKDAPSVVKAKDIQTNWAGYLSLDAVNSAISGMLSAMQANADFEEGLSKAKIAKNRKLAKQMAEIDQKIQRIHNEFARREQEDELAVLMLLH